MESDCQCRLQGDVSIQNFYNKCYFCAEHHVVMEEGFKGFAVLSADDEEGKDVMQRGYLEEKRKLKFMIYT